MNLGPLCFGFGLNGRVLLIKPGFNSFGALLVGFFNRLLRRKTPACQVVADRANGQLDAQAQLYDAERDVKDLNANDRRQIRRAESKPLADAFAQWMVLQRQKVTDGSAIAKALDYSLKRWTALSRFLDDGQLPIDNNWI